MRQFVKLNNIKLKKLIISWDFDDHELGYYLYGKRVSKHKCEIFVNPRNCVMVSTKGYDNHPENNTISAVILHEFSHYIEHLYGLTKQYAKLEGTFKPKILMVTSTSSTCLEEEMAEMVSLFICNPYLLKVIDPDRYKWLRKIIKSPTPCTAANFFKSFSNWCPEAKKECRDKFKLLINTKKKTVNKR